MPKRISKEEEETFFFDPRDNGGLDIVIGDLSPDIMDFFNSLQSNEEPKYKKPVKKKKTYKQGNLMKARTDLKKSGDKYAVETVMNVKKGLEPKVKKALKKSVVEELDKKIKGSGLKKKVKKIDLDFSSDEEPVKRKRGRPKKGGMIPHSGKDFSESKRTRDRNRIRKEIEDAKIDKSAEVLKANIRKELNILRQSRSKYDPDEIIDREFEKAERAGERALDSLDNYREDPHSALKGSAEFRKEGEKLEEFLSDKAEDIKFRNTWDWFAEEKKQGLLPDRVTDGKGLKKRGRPKKGKNIIDDDSSSDEEDLKEYSKILKHLISHITDKKEKLDKKDVKQAKELIDKIKSKKA